MSKVAIQGNASGTGTFTIAAPNSNTDRTLTLPDEAGTVLTSGTPLSSFPTGFVNGITEADHWRLSTTHSHVGANAADIIDSGWERTDDPSSTYIGTGMSQSSGVFTFPSTGKYLVEVSGYYQIDASVSYTGIQVEVTVNGGTNWDPIAFSFSSVPDITGSDYAGTIFVKGLVDVTSTSNVKVRFLSYSSATGINLQGSTDLTATGALFTRLGDT